MATIKIFTLCFALALISTAACWINMNDRLKNLIVHFESRRPGHEKQWAGKSSYHDDEWGYYTRVGEYSDNEILDVEHAKWLAKDCGDGYLCFACAMANDDNKQTMLNRYLMSSYPHKSSRKMLLLREDYSPELHDECKFKVQCTSEDMTNCRLLSKRWSLYWALNWLDGIPNGPDGWYITFHSGGSETEWRIYAPPPSDYFKVIYEAENRGSAVQKYTKTTTIGMSSTTSQSHTITESTTMECSASFGKFSMGASAGVSQTVDSSWQTASEQVFSAEIQTTLVFKTQPGTKLTVSQLMGTYAGVYGVSSESYRYDEVSLDNPANSYSSPVFRFDRDLPFLNLTHRIEARKSKKEL